MPKATLNNMSVSGGAGGDKKSHPGSRDFFFFLKYFFTLVSVKLLTDIYQRSQRRPTPNNR